MTLALNVFRDQAAQPWLNGMGTTRELAKSLGADGSFVWRISLADVDADCDFSSLPGIDRVLMMCEGAGIRLTGDGVQHDLGRGDILSFDGGTAMSCRLIDGATRDLNVMTRRTECTASVGSYSVQSATLVCGAEEELVVVLVDGRLSVDGLGMLSAYDAVVMAGAGQLALTGPARVLVASFRRTTAG